MKCIVMDDDEWIICFASFSPLYTPVLVSFTIHEMALSYSTSHIILYSVHSCGSRRLDVCNVL